MLFKCEFLSIHLCLLFAMACLSSCSRKASAERAGGPAEGQKIVVLIKWTGKKEAIPVTFSPNPMGDVTLKQVVDYVSELYPDARSRLVELSPEMVGIEGAEGGFVVIDPRRDQLERIVLRSYPDGIIRFYEGSLEFSGT